MFEQFEHQLRIEEDALRNYAAVCEVMLVCEWQHFQVRA